MSEGRILYRNSEGIFKMDWYIVGSNEMARHASSVECPNVPQYKLLNVV
jgi:hypothetical protein